MDESAIQAAFRDFADPRALLASLFMHAPLGMALFDREGWLLASNAAHARMFSPRAARSYNVLHDPRLDAYGLRELTRRAFAGEAVSLPPYVHSTGEAGASPLRVTQSSWFPVRGGDGALLTVGLATRDVTAEELLARRVEEVGRFAESGIVGMLHWDAEGRITDANDALLKMLGYTQEELRAGRLRWIDITPPEHIHRDAQALAEIAQTGRCRPFEKEYIRKDGGRVPIIIAAAGFANEARRGISFVLDITERKQAERELAMREARFRTLIAQNSDLLLMVGPDNVVSFASDASARVLGWAAEELVGRPALSDLIHPDDVAAAGEALARCLSGAGEPHRDELRLRHKAGSYRLVECVTRNLLADPAIAALVANIRDISENRALQQQFVQAQKMEAIGRLAGGIAHDFNNMLSGILGFAGIVASELQGDPLAADVAEIIAAAERAASLTRQLLAFSRKQILTPRLVDLGAQLRGLEKLLRRLIGADIEVELVVPPRLGLVKVDPAQVEQVVLNLAINARDAVARGGKIVIETANVELDAEYARQHIDVAAGSYVMLAVTDDGAGMDRHVRERVFEPFFTTKGVGQGTGLGLATVFGVVKQSGGHIWLASEPGRGTTFKVYFPRSFEADEAEEAEAREVSGRGTETILLVEDEPGVRAFARRALERAGYAVLEAENGAEALAIVEGHRGEIDLLLTDVVMPRMSGKVLAQRLLARRPGLRVVYMSGHTEDAIVDHGVLDGGTDFIAKPIALETLLARVRAVLDQGRDER